GRAGSGMLYRRARSVAQQVRKESGLRLASGGRRKIAGSKKRGIETETAQRVALHGQGRIQLRPERHDHWQGDVRHRYAHGRDVIRERRASASVWRKREIGG